MSKINLNSIEEKVEGGIALTKKEAVVLLETLDHAIVGKKAAMAIGEPFKFKPRLTRIQDTRSEFKGAHFPDLKEGEWAEDVIDASILAERLCDHLGVSYVAMHGRGSQLRCCVESLEQVV